MDNQESKVITIPYCPHEFQRLFHNDPTRFRLLLAGIRGGKTIAGANETIKKATERRQDIGIFGPTYPMLRVARDVILHYLPQELILEHNKSEKRIYLTCGSCLHFFSCEDPDSIRGVGLDYAWIDEGGYVKDEAYKVIRGRIAQKRGGLIITTTPKGVGGWLYRFYNNCADPLQKDFSLIKFRSVDNPYFSDEEIERLKEEYPEQFYRQELEAEFIDEAAQVFRRIDDCITSKLKDGGNNCAVGIDLGKRQDYTVLTAIDRQSKKQIGYDRFYRLDWGMQKQRIKNFCDKYKGLALMDSTGVGDPIFDDLVREGMKIVGYKFSNQSKNSLIDALSIATEQEKIGLANIPEQTAELKGFRYKISQAGNFKYGTQAGHDDIVIALALAWWNIKTYGTGVGVIISGGERETTAKKMIW